MTEVDYGGGGHRTRLKDQLINLCVHGVPLASVYKGGEEGRPAGPRGAPKCGVLLGLQVLVGVHQEEGREKEGEGGKGAGPLVQFGLG